MYENPSLLSEILLMLSMQCPVYPKKKERVAEDKNSFVFQFFWKAIWDLEELF